jgi:Mn2+/Fe2+ NRAMP family transporter
VIHVPWLAVARNTFLPQVTFSASYAVTIVAVLGTTISPYLFLWNQERSQVGMALT